MLASVHVLNTVGLIISSSSTQVMSSTCAFAVEPFRPRTGCRDDRLSRWLRSAVSQAAPRHQPRTRNVASVARPTSRPALVLLCRKNNLALTRRQHGHLGRVASKAAAIRSRRVVMDDGTWRCVRWAAARLVIRGQGRFLASSSVFFADAVRVPKLLLHQEAVSSNAQAGMVVEPPPAAPFVVPESQFLLEIS